MIDWQLISAVMAGIALLLILILYFRLQAFIALLISSIAVGLFAGQAPETIMTTVKNGMGGTLGFVATVVGLGAMFGAILEHSGGAKAIANSMIKRMGEGRAPLAMVISGFVIAIPVFFDVAFIILIPVIYALQRRTGKSLLLYAIPLLSGLAITHAFIPPTPGPIAVAEIVGANLGWVILCGLIVGLPTALVSGLWFGRYVAGKIHIAAPAQGEEEEDPVDEQSLPSVSMMLAMIAVPILLILANTLLNSPLTDSWTSPLKPSLQSLFQLIGHPFSALIIANLLAWFFLGINRGMDKDSLFEITTKSMAPAGTIILLTGAGGVFKQMLIDTGTGKMLAESMAEAGIPIIIFAFLSAAIIRVIQGSATVAMITGAGMVAPLLVAAAYSPFQLALIVIAIASGASIFSHVNDSGFWLVSQYLGLSEKETFRSWSVMTTILALTGFVVAAALFMIS